MESLGVLAGSIAHDFNNLLGGVYSQAELLEADLGFGSTAYGGLQLIKAAAKHRSEVVRQLMTYAGENQTNRIALLDVSQIVEEMLELLKVSISKRVVLKMDLNADLPAVPGNASELRQIVINLVINASEAVTEKEGLITVATASRTAGEIEGSGQASGLAQGNYVQFRPSTISPFKP